MVHAFFLSTGVTSFAEFRAGKLIGEYVGIPMSGGCLAVMVIDDA